MTQTVKEAWESAITTYLDANRASDRRRARRPVKGPLAELPTELTTA